MGFRAQRSALIVHLSTWIELLGSAFKLSSLCLGFFMCLNEGTCSVTWEEAERPWRKHYFLHGLCELTHYIKRPNFKGVGRLVIPAPVMPSIPVAMSMPWVSAILISMVVRASMVVMIKATTDGLKLLISQFDFGKEISRCYDLYIIVNHSGISLLLLLVYCDIDLECPLRP